MEARGFSFLAEAPLGGKSRLAASRNPAHTDIINELTIGNLDSTSSRQGYGDHVTVFLVLQGDNLPAVAVDGHVAGKKLEPEFLRLVRANEEWIKEVLSIYCRNQGTIVDNFKDNTFPFLPGIEPHANFSIFSFILSFFSFA